MSTPVEMKAMRFRQGGGVLAEISHVPVWLVGVGAPPTHIGVRNFEMAVPTSLDNLLERPKFPPEPAGVRVLEDGRLPHPLGQVEERGRNTAQRVAISDLLLVVRREVW